MPQNVPNWLVDWSFVSIIGNTEPPRDPDDDDDGAEDEEGDDEPDGLDPAVIGELDEYALPNGENRIPRARQILGNHMAASLVTAADGRGGTLITEGSQTANPLTTLTRRTHRAAGRGLWEWPVVMLDALHASCSPATRRDASPPTSPSCQSW